MKKIKILVSSNKKGGVGKTSTAVNVAAHIGESKKVILVDGDEQGNTTTWLVNDNMEVTHELADVLYGKVQAADAIVNVRQGLDLLPTFGKGGDLDEFRSTGISQRRKALSKLNRELESLGYDVVIYDLGPAVGLFEEEVIAAADEVYTTVEAEYLAVDGVDAFASKLASIRDRYDCTTAHRLIVVNRVNGSYGRHTVQRKALQGFNYHLIEIPQCPRLPEAPALHQVIFDYDKFAKSCEPMRQIGDFLLTEI
jgi:chromosome partitioning protein